MPTTLWFARHGEVESPYVGTFVGSTDVGLSDVGKHQAQAIGHYLHEAGIDAIITSPKKRAMDTAAPLAELTGLKPEVYPGLAEMDFGAWEGLRWDQIVAKDEAFANEWQQDPTTLPCPGGESAGDFYKRATAAVETMLQEHEGRNVVMFSHAGTNRAILANVIGIPYMQSFNLAQDYGCLNAAGWAGEMSQVALVNFVPGPPSRHNGDGQRPE